MIFLRQINIQFLLAGNWDCCEQKKKTERIKCDDEGKKKKSQKTKKKFRIINFDFADFSEQM